MAEDKTKENKGGSGSVMASLAGAALGVAVGAGAIILSDKKNRKKLEDALEGLKKQGFKVLDIVQKEAENVGNKLKPAKKAAKGKKKK